MERVLSRQSSRLDNERAAHHGSLQRHCNQVICSLPHVELMPQKGRVPAAGGLITCNHRPSLSTSRTAAGDDCNLQAVIKTLIKTMTFENSSRKAPSYWVAITASGSTFELINHPSKAHRKPTHHRHSEPQSRLLAQSYSTAPRSTFEKSSTEKRSLPSKLSSEGVSATLRRNHYFSLGPSNLVK